jgi:hypothetical protein
MREYRSDTRLNNVNRQSGGLRGERGWSCGSFSFFSCVAAWWLNGVRASLFRLFCEELHPLSLQNQKEGAALL